MDVLNSGVDFERIEVSASELDVLDDEGSVGARGVTVFNTFIQFEETQPDSPVVFYDGVFEKITKNTKRFQIPLKNLKKYFDVLTIFEVMERLDEYFGKGHTWSFKQLKEYFSGSTVDAASPASNPVLKTKKRTTKSEYKGLKQLLDKNIKIAKKVMGKGSEHDFDFEIEPNYKGYDVVICFPASKYENMIVGQPMYVLIKDGEGHIAFGDELDELHCRNIGDYKDIEDCCTPEDYKKAVKDYMMIQLGVSEQVADSLIKENSATLDGAWEDKLSVPASATGLLHGFL